jgi:hypothetical protein
LWQGERSAAIDFKRESDRLPHLIRQLAMPMNGS